MESDSLPVPNTDLPLKTYKDLRGVFPSGKAEDAGGLSPTKDDNVAWRKNGRKECTLLTKGQYKGLAGEMKTPEVKTKLKRRNPKHG